jgi:SAM-dependent methyltransferase
MISRANCQICGSEDWLDLPNPAEERSITTAGRIINEPLGKAQCVTCGCGQRIRAPFVGLTDYYEQDYAKYYDRPGTTQFHAARYRVLADWMTSVLKSFTPRTILDIGCGQGWAMEAMKAFYPYARIEGLEPSHYNSEVAREKGFAVHGNRLSDAAMPPGQYDLIYSNNVLQHVTNTRAFVTSLKKVAGEDGVIVITCPDGSVPNIEILWADQNFSFLPTHLIDLCREVGFATINWFSSPFSPSVPPAQLLLLSANRSFHGKKKPTNVPAPDLEEIYRSRCEYLVSFKQIDDYICSRTKECERVFNLGASYWSSILAAYCPQYWQRVSACLVDTKDEVDQAFLGKEVLQLASIQATDTDAIVLGTSPMTHNALRAKIASSSKLIISWNGFSVRY